MYQLSISVSSVVRVLVAIAIFLVLASTAGQLSGYLFQHGNVFGLVRGQKRDQIGHKRGQG